MIDRKEPAPLPRLRVTRFEAHRIHGEAGYLVAFAARDRAVAAEIRRALHSLNISSTQPMPDLGCYWVASDAMSHLGRLLPELDAMRPEKVHEHAEVAKTALHAERGHAAYAAYAARRERRLSVVEAMRADELLRLPPPPPETPAPARPKTALRNVRRRGDR